RSPTTLLRRPPRPTLFPYTTLFRSRAILSRELSLEEIGEIRERVPDMELEVFVHGALCMAYSGRCLLSGYINKRDPNQGTCTNRSEEHTSELQSRENLVCRLLLEKK